MRLKRAFKINRNCGKFSLSDIQSHLQGLIILNFWIIAANSYQNLFGEPAERARPLAKKVSKTIPPEPRSRKPKPLPGELSVFTSNLHSKLWSGVKIAGNEPQKLQQLARKLLISTEFHKSIFYIFWILVDPLTGEVIGHRDLVAALSAKQELSAPAPVKSNNLMTIYKLENDGLQPLLQSFYKFNSWRKTKTCKLAVFVGFLNWFSFSQIFSQAVSWWKSLTTLVIL